MTLKKYLNESIRVGDRDLTVEVGRVARQADGSCVIRYGDTMVLCAAVGALTPREGIDFFPLTVEYREAFFAAGRIPGNYFRREGRPNEKEVLTSRLIDRPCRPLFTEGYRNETQVVASVVSADPNNNPDVVAITGASCALYLSDIPFPNPIAGVRVGLIDGRYIVNPTYDEIRESKLNLIVAGTEEAIVMVEAGAQEVSEEIMVEALMLAHKEINRLCRWQKEPYKALGIEKRLVEPTPLNEEMLGEIERNYAERLRAALDTTGQEKRASYAAVDALKKEVVESYPEDQPERRAMAKTCFDHLKEKIFRDDILNHRRRPDGRRFSEIRAIDCEIGWLPRAHGSALFTRGETQAMVTTTLGTKEDEQFIDDIEKGEVKRRFLLHYNFPHYSVGEVGRFGSSSRREIGHGALARRAIEAVLPDASEFPYTLRIVSDITESNGSPSMASICGRMHILDAMDQAISEPRAAMSPYAPRIIQIKINPDKIRDVIGPGGKVIRALVEETGAKIDVADDGTISIATADSEAAEAAVNRIRGLTAEAEVGETYVGTVSRIVDFGAFVEIFPGTDGLLHISEIADRRIRDVRDELKEGQQIMVKCIGKDGNKIKLSRKAVLRDENRQADAASSHE